MNRTGLLKTTLTLFALALGLGLLAPDDAAAQTRFHFAPDPILTAGDPTDPEDALATPSEDQVESQHRTRSRSSRARVSDGNLFERFVSFLVTYVSTPWEPRR